MISTRTQRSLVAGALGLLGAFGIAGCGQDSELIARPVPRNMCDTVGEALLHKLAPGGQPYDRVGDITDERKTISCGLETEELDLHHNREPVLLVFAVSRFGSVDEHKPYEEANEWLEQARGKTEKKQPKGAEVTFNKLDGYTGYIWVADYGDETRPELEYAVRKDDTVLQVTYRPVAGIPANTAKKWILDAGDQVLGRFNDVQYGL